MKKLKWNRYCTIFVMLTFITVTYASFNTNLFINGTGYVRVDKDIRITNIRLLEVENNGYENVNSEYSVDSVSMDVSLPKQASSVTYEATISNVSDKRYKISDILESSYNNKDVKYELVDASIGNIVEPHTTKTFKVRFTNNIQIVEEDDVYETKEYTFDYTGGEQVFTVPYDGTYKIELWGAQGGDANSYKGGYGAYSTGTMELKKNRILYINVGGKPKSSANGSIAKGGYNGGAQAETKKTADTAGSGGGATHIAIKSGELSKLSQSKDKIIMVAGGGGGAYYYEKYRSSGGSAGGITGNNAPWDGKCEDRENHDGQKASQTKSGGNSSCGYNADQYYGKFGSGGIIEAIYDSSKWYSGGGAGWYGGGAGYAHGANGGSSYIGYQNLTNKTMYCYNCEESSEEATKTISTENHSATPTSNYAKEGNGYAKLTITRKIENNSNFDFDFTGKEQTFSAPYSGIYKLETWGAQGGTNPSGSDKRKGGYGGYSTGNVSLKAGEKLYVYVGAQNRNFNGGGKGDLYGGGATHIALQGGQLNTLSEKVNQILIVSGGGGGNDTCDNIIPSAGGYKANTINFIDTVLGGTQFPNPQTQYSGTFGQGGTAGYITNTRLDYGGGGGGGFYGGDASATPASCGAGGSGYIGNTLLTEKVMYCYNCEESKEENTKTVTTQAHSKSPKQFQAKEGDGYSRITLIKRTINQTKLTLDFTFKEYLNGNEYTFSYTGEPQTFTVPKTGYYKVELWGASGNNTRNDYIMENPTYGGYTSGKIKLQKGEKLNVYVGGKEKRFNSTTATAGGISGGATDIRLKQGANWYDLDSLSSRIMVAGGAGQTYNDGTAASGGNAGGLHSYGFDRLWGVNITSQTIGGLGTKNESTDQFNYQGGDGSFGIGGAPINKIKDEGVVSGGGYHAGAGGYYGGGGGPSGGGGSSFISGHNGCVAIKAESDTTPRNDSSGNQCVDGTTDITCSYHYSNYKFTDTKMIDGKGYQWTTEVGTVVVGMPTHDGTSTMNGNDGNGFAKITLLEEIPEYTFDYTGKSQEFIAPYKGIYKVELWGASGGYTEIEGNYGAYTSGEIELKKNQKLYLYVGSQGESINYEYTTDTIYNPFNGGGRGKHQGRSFTKRIWGSGGSATDIRLTAGNWDDFESLKSRIMVAGAGGGGHYYDENASHQGGAGGGLVGYNGDWNTNNNTWGTYGYGGTQTEPGYCLCEENTHCTKDWKYAAGKFGIGGFGYGGFYDGYTYSGGGSGYFGGGSSLHVQSAGGGSSYISGHKGCVSIDKNSTSDNITFINDSNGVACNDSSSVGYNTLGYNTDSYCNKHYSGLSFTNTTMIDGRGYLWNENGVSENIIGMPSLDSRTTMIGNKGNGYAKITLVDKVDTYQINYDLDGGTLSKKRNSYTTFDDDITLGTPTKEGAKFLGWTGGKSIFNYDYILSKQVNGNGNTATTSGKRGIFDVKPNTYYTLSTNLPKRGDGGCYVLLSSSDDVNSEIYSGVDGAYLNHSITVKSTSEGHIIIAYFQHLMSMEMVSKMESGEYWFQIEEGSSATAHEPNITTPTTSVTIPTRSTGNRTYTANWDKDFVIEYDLDGGTNLNNPKYYRNDTETFTLKEPSKEGYTFTGWTVGKNIYRYTGYANNAQCSSTRLEDGTIKIVPSTSIASGIYMGLTSDRYKKYLYHRDFVLSFDLKADEEKVIHVCIDNGGECKYVSLTTEWQRFYLTQKNFDNNTWHAFTVYNNNNGVSSTQDPYYIRNIQMEYGDKSTEYEEPITVSTKEITIPKGSAGNRVYTANWVANEST